MTTGSEPLRVTLVTDILPGYSKDGATTYLENVISGLSEQGAVVRVPYRIADAISTSLFFTSRIA